MNLKKSGCFLKYFKNCKMLYYDDLFISPKGRLKYVDNAVEAINREGITSVAVRNDQCAVVASQKRKDPNLVAETTNFFELTYSIACVATGLGGDCQAQVLKARNEARRFRKKIYHDMGIDVLCRRMADINQVYTQTLNTRPLACAMMFISYDDHFKGPRVYKTDPSALYCDYYACASGTNMLEAEDFLRKNYKKNLTEKNIIQLAVDCLTNISANDEFRPSDFEVGIVSKCRPRFRRLDVEEIKEYFPFSDDIKYQI